MDETRPDPTRTMSSADRVADVVETVKQYARQETVEPIRGAARWVGVGTVASLCLGISMLYAALAVLRASQDLGGTALDGAWSFVHYLVTVVVLAVLVWVAVSRIGRTSLAKGS